MIPQPQKSTSANERLLQAWRMCPQIYTLLQTRNYNETQAFPDEESMLRLAGIIFQKKVFVTLYSDTYILVLSCRRTKRSVKLAGEQLCWKKPVCVGKHWLTVCQAAKMISSILGSVNRNTNCPEKSGSMQPWRFGRWAYRAPRAFQPELFSDDLIWGISDHRSYLESKSSWIFSWKRGISDYYLSTP